MEPETLATIDPDLQVFRLMQTVTELRAELLTERASAFRIFRQHEVVMEEQAAEIAKLRGIIDAAKVQAHGIRRFIVSHAFTD